MGFALLNPSYAGYRLHLSASGSSGPGELDFEIRLAFAGDHPVVHRHIISGLSAALAAVGVVFWLYAANGATASAKGQAGSAVVPQELLGSVETRSMPVLRFEDQSVIYPGRN
jgi:hypothetical protein